MKKLILLLFVVLFAVYSCSPTINRPLFAKSDNAKELILGKYGKPSKVENLEEKEIWRYDYISQFKSNRTIVFDNYGKIISNKKHYKFFHMATGFNKHWYIATGGIIVLTLITGPFPALLWKQTLTKQEKHDTDYALDGGKGYNIVFIKNCFDCSNTAIFPLFLDCLNKS